MVRLPLGGAAATPIPDGTVPRGLPAREERIAAPPPEPLDLATLRRGREGFEMFCSPCHGRTGYGDGMVARHGFPPPPSFHSDRLRAVPPAYIVPVITHGFGVMYPYASRVEPEERWAIAAYVKALQLSQRAPVADLPEADRGRLPAPEG